MKKWPIVAIVVAATVVCTQCGSDNVYNAAYCCRCGSEDFTQKGSPLPSEFRRCPHCDKQTPHDPNASGRCDQCGKPINADGTAG